jgi:hypothetical protein
MNMNLNQIRRHHWFFKLLYFLRFYEICFYFIAFEWHWRHKTPLEISTGDIYELFYLDFLKVPEKDCKIIEMSEKRLITRCKNECPILEISKVLGIDTRRSCKQVSEGPCKFFLRKLNRGIVFERNYGHIRPYAEDCEEIITLP